MRRSRSVKNQVHGLGPDARVVVVSPDEITRAAIGPNSLDPAHLAPATRAGRAQSPSLLVEVRDVWQGGPGRFPGPD